MSSFSHHAHQMLQAFEQSAEQENLARLPQTLRTRCFGEKHLNGMWTARSAQIAATRFKLALQNVDQRGSETSASRRMASSCMFYMKPLPTYGADAYAVQSDHMLIRPDMYVHLSRTLPVICADLDRLQDKIMHRGAPVLDFEGADFERIQTIGLLLAHRMGPLVQASPCGYVPAFIPFRSGVLMATAHPADPDHYRFDPHSVVAVRDDKHAKLMLDDQPAAMTMPQAEIVIRGFQPMTSIPEYTPLRGVVRDLSILTHAGRFDGAAVMSIVDYTVGQHIPDEMTRHHIPVALGISKTFPRGDEAIQIMKEIRDRQTAMNNALDSILSGHHWELASQAAMEILQQKHILHWGAVCPSPSATQPCPSDVPGASRIGAEVGALSAIPSPF